MVKDYVTYPREFDGYKWYKPLLSALVAAVFTAVITCAMVFVAVLMIIQEGGDPSLVAEALRGGYSGFDSYSAPGAILSLGVVVAFLPGIVIATAIVKDRSVASLSSSRGGWNMKVFFKCLAAAFVILGIPTIIYHLISTGDIRTEIRFTVIGFIFCTVLGPLQCIAEEFLFRSMIMQTIGSWFKISIVGVIAQVVIFASLHPYGILGVTEIVICGTLLGLIAWKSNGLEASSAIHIVNNLTIFYFTGFGIGQISDEEPIPSVIITILFMIAYTLFIVLFAKKKGWFDEIKTDDVAVFNMKKKAKAQNRIR
ncbi:MAG: CPBP family intramembrane metalloprotease [Clostridiales bacterium]|nr:CPBP family intramembrane metalloprotease [Clostridiales bacterium]